MSDFTDLRRAILAAPDDDVVRLIFADLLEEQGQPERAEFVRLQIRLAQVPTYTPEFMTLRHRERELIVAHGLQWRQSLPPFSGISWGPFVRGFISSVEARRWSDYTLCAHELVNFEPVQHLEIRRLTVPFEEVYTSPLIEKLSGLDLSSIVLETTQVVDLMDCAGVSHLRDLVMGRDALDDRAGVALFGSPMGANLRRLKANGNRFTDISLRELRDGTRPHLQYLDLSYNPINPSGVEHLAHGQRLDQLTMLHLCNCGVEDTGARVLARSPNSARYRHLDLSNNWITVAGARAIAESPHFDDIARLDMAYNQISLEGRQMLVDRFGNRVWV